MAFQEVEERDEKPPELFWDVRKVVMATLVFTLFGSLIGLVTYFVMTYGFQAQKNKAEMWLYAIPAASTAFGFLASLFFAFAERRKLLSYYRDEA